MTEPRVSETTVCQYQPCGKRFRRGRRQNQHQRAGGAVHRGGRYCSKRHRVAAFRARAKARSASVTASVTEVASSRPSTTPHASVTCAMQTIETAAEISTGKTVLGPQELPGGIVPDAKWPGMWRVRYPDGRLSDMVNLSRANDVAACFAETEARRRRTYEVA
jgi:hypothetical protein